MSHKKKTPTENKTRTGSNTKKMAILTQRILNIMGHKKDLNSITPLSSSPAPKITPTKKPKF